MRATGVGLGQLVLALDATLVRLVLVPATMTLLGRRNWWLPGWLDRVLPGSARVPSSITSPAGDVPAVRPERARMPV